MADTKISAETAASVLDGTELFVGVQGGANVKVTADQIKTRAQTGAALLSSNNTFTGTSQTISGAGPLNLHLNTTGGGDGFLAFDNGGTNYAQVNGNSVSGLFSFVNSGMSHHFYVGGTDTLDITGTGLNLLTGKVLSVNSVTILDGSGILQAAGHPALTGDVTNSAGSLATTIATNAVTYAKFQQVAASSLVGNATGSLANAAGITLAGGLSFSGSTLTAAGALTPTSVASTGAVTSSSASAGVGYATGAGGTATQATSKATTVSGTNKMAVDITLNGAALAASTTVSFTFTNTSIAAADNLLINHVSVGTFGSYTFNGRAAAGSATIDVRNVSLGSLSEAIVIRVTVIKGATS